MEDNFIKGSKATKILGVHQRTLYQWEEKGWIETKRTKGGIRLYNVDKYLREIEKSKKETKKDQINNDNRTDNCDDIDEICKKETNLCINYIRVSSLGQKNDLLRQELYIKKKYPNNILIKDIGSGVNMNRRGLRKIIYLAIEGKLKQLVIVHKDRLTRFGFDLIKDLIKKYSNGELIILDKKEDQEPEEELVKDVLQIMNVFVARMNGMRKYSKKTKKTKETKET